MAIPRVSGLVMIILAKEYYSGGMNLLIILNNYLMLINL